MTKCAKGHLGHIADFSIVLTVLWVLIKINVNRLAHIFCESVTGIIVSYCIQFDNYSTNQAYTIDAICFLQ